MLNLWAYYGEVSHFKLQLISYLLCYFKKWVESLVTFGLFNFDDRSAKMSYGLKAATAHYSEISLQLEINLCLMEKFDISVHKPN